MRPDLHLETEPERILAHFGEIIQLANSERNGLGFLSEQALRDGICRGKMLTLLDRSLGKKKLVAYLLYSGVYPHAKIQQIATINSYRQQGVASALVRALVNELEQFGFMTIRADVASDLQAALAFYQKNHFEQVRTKPGGKSRQRKIIIHVRELDTDTLFSREINTKHEIDLGIPARHAHETPFFALDLNVYFDLARNRSESDSARQLFSAVLDHRLRIAVADEFVRELRRTSDEETDDPVLQLALRLPRMPKADVQELERLRGQIHEVVFVQGKASGAGSKQAWSDAEHLAHATLAQASAFVTRDGAILRSRSELLRRFGIDVLSVDELLIALPSELEDNLPAAQYGTGFVCAGTDAQTIRDYIRSARLSTGLVTDFSKEEGRHSTKTVRLAIQRNNDVIACAVLLEPKTPRPICRLFVHARPEVLGIDLYVDHLLDTMLREVSATGATAIELEHVPGQSMLNTTARTRGFVRQPSTATLVKVAMGRPVTTSSWDEAANELRLRTGLELPDTMPVGDLAKRFSIRPRHSKEIMVSLRSLERMLSPALLIRPDQHGVIVPITRHYSNDLLGANIQRSLDLDDDKDAAFLSRRAYVNTPHAANKMHPGSPILFYESLRNGGSGGIVAVARIVDTKIMNKADIPDDLQRRLVVQNVNGFSSVKEVLVTIFEDVFVLPNPVLLKLLREIGAVDGANMITAKKISGQIVTEILDKGWIDE